MRSRNPFSPGRSAALALGLSLLVASWFWPVRADKPVAPRSPLTAEQARKAFRVAPGLRVELVACEPQIESPVAMAFDEDGRLWVVEMRDYPNGPPKGQPPQGRLRILEDKDGDGRYEQSTVYADKLLFANGVMPWRGGALVTAAPHIVYLKDGRREVLYEGFAAENPQLRVSHPNLGLDNWIYVANGLRGGQVKRSGKADARPINLSGMDFRFDLIHDRGEAISGPGQYGNTFDDWGRRFVCDNRHHLRHVVLPYRYLKRNPLLAVPQVLQDVSELEEGVAGAGAKIYPLSKNWTTSNLHAGRFTAACGVFVYRGDLLPEEYRGCAFTCDPTGNLIHREVLRPDGASFRSRPGRKGVEFLATPDDWCRPVFLSYGPDGAMYVVDMYRAVIEHPEYMPPELRKRPDLTLGKDKGRIWRIVPEKPRGKSVRPKLSKASSAELVALLEHRNAWWRTTAQRLLLERQDRSALEPLRKLLATSKEPLARVHAVWLLDGLCGLEDKDLLPLLRDSHPRVREQAVLLAESRLKNSAALRERVVALASDSDARVRFQVALSLGEWSDAKALAPLAKIALVGAEDQWTRTAVATAVPGRAGALLAVLLKSEQGLTVRRTSGRLALLRELTALVGARRNAEEIAGVLRVVLQLSGKESTPWQMAALEGLADGMGRRGGHLGNFLKTLPESDRKVAAAANTLLARSATVAADTKRELAERLAAVRLLAHVPWEAAGPALTRLLRQDASRAVRLAAVQALSAHSRSEVAVLLLKGWRAYTPALRREVTEALLRQPDRILALLKEMDAGRVKPGDLDTVRRRQLVNHRNAEVRTLARKLLHDAQPAERRKVLERYRAALARKGDPGRGREVFKKNCATCHHVADIGVDVGPDISDTRTKTAEALLGDILDPNQAIDNNYVNYLVTLKSGKSLSGIIAAETASSITLRRAEKQTDVVLRQDIEEIASSGVSLMPEGLEKTITIAEMADLLDFLKNWRYLDGAVPRSR